MSNKVSLEISDSITIKASDRITEISSGGELEPIDSFIHLLLGYSKMILIIEHDVLPDDFDKRYPTRILEDITPFGVSFKCINGDNKNSHELLPWESIKRWRWYKERNLKKADIEEMIEKEKERQHVL